MEGLIVLLGFLLILMFLLSAVEGPTATEDAKREIHRIGDAGEQEMERLTSQFREHIDEQTRRYR